MKDIIKLLHPKRLFHISLLVFVFTLPIWRQVNTIALWLMVLGWLISSDFSTKKQFLLQNKKAFLLIFSLYLIYVFSGLHDCFLHCNFRPLERSLPLLIIPLIILSVDKTELQLKPIFIALGLGLGFGMLLSWGVIIESILDRPSHLYLEQAKYFFQWSYTSHNLLKFIGMHPSFFGILLVLFLVVFLQENLFKSFRKYRLAYLAVVFSLLLFLFETSSRISVIVLLLILIIKNLKRITFKNSIGIVAVGLIVVLVGIKFDYLASKMTHLTADERLYRWQEILNVFFSKPYWFLGVGYDGAEQVYLEAYNNGGFELAIKENYNAHNQFLEFFVQMGVLGVGSYLAVFYYFVKKTKLAGITLYFIIIFIFYSLTDSFLERSKGLFIFSFFYGLLIQHYPSSSKPNT